MKIYTMMPRIQKPQQFLENLKNNIICTEKYGFSGILVFTANNIFIDPWLIAQQILSTSRSLIPLVAVNPVYMHPFSAAKMISSLSFHYRKQIDVNCIIGTRLSDQQALNDFLDHNERYERLKEYVEIVQLLLKPHKTVDYDGAYYKVNKLELLPKIENELFPDFYISGSSPAVRSIIEKLGGIQIHMSINENLLADKENKGYYFGVVTRPTAEEARAAASKLFPESPIRQLALAHSLDDTDSAWKNDLFEQLGKQSTGPRTMQPFKNLHSDSSYYVGSYEELSAFFNEIKEHTTALILNIPNVEEEYFHIQQMLALTDIEVQNG